MNARQSFKKFLLVFLSLFIWSALAGQAWATQTHPPEEAIYVHQIGHFCFIISLGILIYWLRQHELVRERGWRFIQYSAFFFILWNMDAVVAHYLESIPGIFETSGFGRWNLSLHEISGHTALTFLYYMARMDHLLCVPAIIFLYIGLEHLVKHPGPCGLPEQHS